MLISLGEVETKVTWTTQLIHTCARTSMISKSLGSLHKERQIAKHIISISQGVPLMEEIYLPAFLRVTAVRILSREHENSVHLPVAEDIRRPSSEEFWGRSEYFQRRFKYFLVSVPRCFSPPKSLWLVFLKNHKIGEGLIFGAILPNIWINDFPDARQTTS